MDRSMMNEETKATSQHQITIPKKIWEMLGLKAGIRFQVFLSEENDIVVRPKTQDLRLEESEWDELCQLAKSKKNISRKFKNTKEATDYLDKL